MTSLTDYINRRGTKAAAPAPAATPVAADPDSTTRAAWGISQEAWQSMKDLDRVWHRWNVTKAPFFKA